MLGICFLALIAVYDPVAMTVTFFLMWLVGFSFPAPIQTRILRSASAAPNLASTLISTAFNVGIAGGAWLGALALSAGWGYARLPWISIAFMGAALIVALLSWAIERRAVARSPVVHTA
jgi:DHA1 family inner membrane transport protein